MAYSESDSRRLEDGARRGLIAVGVQYLRVGSFEHHAVALPRRKYAVDLHIDHSLSCGGCLDLGVFQAHVAVGGEIALGILAEILSSLGVEIFHRTLYHRAQLLVVGEPAQAVETAEDVEHLCRSPLRYHRILGSPAPSASACRSLFQFCQCRGHHAAGVAPVEEEHQTLHALGLAQGIRHPGSGIEQHLFELIVARQGRHQRRVGGIVGPAAYGACYLGILLHQSVGHQRRIERSGSLYRRGKLAVAQPGQCRNHLPGGIAVVAQICAPFLHLRELHREVILARSDVEGGGFHHILL